MKYKASRHKVDELKSDIECALVTQSTVHLIHLLTVFFRFPIAITETQINHRQKHSHTRKMQVESSNASGLHNRARLFARIPASIDLRSVSNCQAESEKHWKSSGGQNGSSFSKPLHVKTSNLENTLVKLGSDGLPLGKCCVGRSPSRTRAN